MKNNNKYYIKVLSPVSVGSGGSISPLMDYIQNEDEIMYINEGEFTNLLDKTDLIDVFSEKVKKVSKRDKSTFLRNFLNEYASVDPDEVADFNIPFYRDSHDNPVEIAQIVKTKNHAYIPGSSVKGAIRTYILYDWMKEHLSITEEFINELDRVYSEYQNQIRIQPNEIRRIKRKLCKDTDRWFKTNIEDVCFKEGKNDESFLMQFLSISDTINNTKTKWAVYQTERVHLRNGDKVLSTPREAILVNNIFEIEIKRITTQHRPESYNLPTIDKLWTIINTLNHDLITHELDIWEGCEHNFEGSYYAVEIIDFYKHLLEDLKKGKRFICIGFGKTYYLNSIGLLIKQKSPEAFKKLRELYSMEKEGQKFFPVTRTVCFDGVAFVPVGWIEIMDIIELQEKAEVNKKETDATIIPEIPEIIEEPSLNFTLENYAGIPEIGTIIQAKLTKTGKPHSQLDLMINDEIINVQMTGTKTASNIKELTEGMILYVEVTSMHNETISQVKFKSFEK
jgi:CRISPR-associated protein Csm5